MEMDTSWVPSAAGLSPGDTPSELLPGGEQRSNRTHRLELGWSQAPGSLPFLPSGDFKNRDSNSTYHGVLYLISIKINKVINVEC